MTDLIQPRLPNPGVCEDGSTACNQPLVVGGVTVGYCDMFVRPAKTSWRGRRRSFEASAGDPRPVPHKGPHRIEWYA